MVARLDFKRTLKDLHSATGKVKQVDAGPASFLAFEGRGEPRGNAFQVAIGELYSVAYALKFMLKKAVLARGGDSSAVEVMPWLEGPGLQVMHVGPYHQVGVSYQRLHDPARELDLSLGGPGHEIYVSDRRRTAPEKLKTIVRIPIAKDQEKRVRLNRAWHQAHPMPKNATSDQRIAWHQTHAQECGCRPIPPALAEEIRRLGKG